MFHASKAVRTKWDDKGMSVDEEVGKDIQNIRTKSLGLLRKKLGEMIAEQRKIMALPETVQEDGKDEGKARELEMKLYVEEREEELSGGAPDIYDEKKIE